MMLKQSFGLSVIFLVFAGCGSFENVTTNAENWGSKGDENTMTIPCAPDAPEYGRCGRGNPTPTPMPTPSPESFDSLTDIELCQDPVLCLSPGDDYEDVGGGFYLGNDHRVHQLFETVIEGVSDSDMFISDIQAGKMANVPLASLPLPTDPEYTYVGSSCEIDQFTPLPIYKICFYLWAKFETFTGQASYEKVMNSLYCVNDDQAWAGCHQALQPQHGGTIIRPAGTYKCVGIPWVEEVCHDFYFEKVTVTPQPTSGDTIDSGKPGQP